MLHDVRTLTWKLEKVEIFERFRLLLLSSRERLTIFHVYLREIQISFTAMPSLRLIFSLYEPILTPFVLKFKKYW